MAQTLTYRIALGVAVAAPAVLLGLSLTIGVLAEPGAAVDRIYYVVLGVGCVGALLARFEARGMAYAMIVTAGVQAMVIPSALASGLHRAPASSLAEVVGLNGLFVAVFAGAAALFWFASLKARAA